jgi:hypothetical protein
MNTPTKVKVTQEFLDLNPHIENAPEIGEIIELGPPCEDENDPVEE